MGVGVFVGVGVGIGVFVGVLVGAGANVAVTNLTAVIVTWQVPVPEHSPPHPVKVEPVDADAVRVTTVL